MSESFPFPYSIEFQTRYSEFVKWIMFDRLRAALYVLNAGGDIEDLMERMLGDDKNKVDENGQPLYFVVPSYQEFMAKHYFQTFTFFEAVTNMKEAVKDAPPENPLPIFMRSDEQITSSGVKYVARVIMLGHNDEISVAEYDLKSMPDGKGAQMLYPNEAFHLRQSFLRVSDMESDNWFSVPNKGDL